MRIVDTSEMREIEQKAKKNFQFTERLIIENISVKGSEVIHKRILSQTNPDEVVFFIGAGNNGADGVAIARQLTTFGYRVRAFLLFNEDEMVDELKYQLSVAKSFGVIISRLESAQLLEEYCAQNSSNLIMIDAMFGTGVILPLSNFHYDVIKTINKYSSYTVSLDLPSGVEGDTGFIQGNCIEADLTLAVGLPKLGCYVADGARVCGEVEVLDAGFPWEVMQNGNKFILAIEDVIDTAGSRNKFADKKIFGHTLVIGGSHGLTGALVMASQAALKVGAGLITGATWEPQYQEFLSRVIPEIMTGYVPIDTKMWPRLIKDLDKYSAIVIGPGLARSTRARKLVLEILNNFKGPVVVDADAINVLSVAEDADVFAKRDAPTVLTPHYGEFARFTGVDIEDLKKKPVHYLKELVDKINCSIILKGPCTYLGFPDGNVYFNYLPNDGMATGGVGDVLAGILGGLLGQDAQLKKAKYSLMQRYNSFNKSICLAVYLHSLSGQIAAKNLGVRSMSAMSLIDFFPQTFDELNKRVEHFYTGEY